jgi:hypothetical protein
MSIQINTMAAPVGPLLRRTNAPVRRYNEHADKS